jgi:hypothetical protein
MESEICKSLSRRKFKEFEDAPLAAHGFTPTFLGVRNSP